MTLIQKQLRAIRWRTLVLHAITVVFLLATTAPHLPVFAGSSAAQFVTAAVDFDNGQPDPALPVGKIHHRALCDYHPVARQEARLAAAPFAVARIIYTAARYEFPQSLAPPPVAPPPRA